MGPPVFRPSYKFHLKRSLSRTTVSVETCFFSGDGPHHDGRFFKRDCPHSSRRQPFAKSVTNLPIIVVLVSASHRDAGLAFMNACVYRSLHASGLAREFFWDSSRLYRSQTQRGSSTCNPFAGPQTAPMTAHQKFPK